MKAEVTTSATRKAVKDLEADNKALRIRNKKKDIAILMEHLKKAQLVDMCFLVDCTSSMEICIDEVKSNISKITKEVSKFFPDLKVRLAFVGYRDLDDGEYRFSILDFVEFIPTFESFVADVEAIGGADTCEDVFGGIDRALELNWKFKTRMILHFADAPCHGLEYHDDDCSDDHPYGDPNGLAIEGLLDEMMSKEIQYKFYHLNDSTRKMIEVFKSKSHLDIEDSDMSDGFASMTKSLSVSICNSISLVERSLRPRGGRHMPMTGLSTISEATTILEYKLVPEYPRSFKSIRATIFKCQLPKIKADLKKSMFLKPGPMVQIDIAPHPFAEGASRICYYGLERDGKTKRKVVLKEFQDTIKNSKEHYQVLIEISGIAYYLGMMFNKHLGESVIDFILPSLVVIDDPAETPSKSTDFFSSEPQIEGEYKKFNNNFGFVHSDEKYHQALNAFSHWTYEFTDGYMMVVDLQGVVSGSKYILTDPAIHCESSKDSEGLERFGNTNFGKAGMKKFFSTHTCNKVCLNLGLRKPVGT